MKLLHSKYILLVAALFILLASCIFLTPLLTGQSIKRVIHVDRSTLHILGGFGVDSVERAAQASSDGIEVAFDYDTLPDQNSALGRQFTRLHMKLIDTFPWNYLQTYECHRLHLRTCASSHRVPISGSDLLQDIRIHLQQVRTNQLIAGYWILDDWFAADPGGARALLPQIRALIHRYAPGKPVICGFGAELGVDNYTWQDWVAENFSPQGCDMIGFYIYAAPQRFPAPPASSYDWTMSSVLPAMFHSLEQQGWDINHTPFIGIGQAWGGHTKSQYFPELTEQSITDQSKSFCQHGAAGLAFYGWNDSSFAPFTQTPMNSSEITSGIHDGIAACKQYWSA